MNHLVFIENNRPVTDSLTIAKTFGKNHKDVLRDIRSLECSEEFAQRNFAPSSYTSEQNKELPKYLITQDGFTFLVMGYTGSEAARFKEMYIIEFNRMREQTTAITTPRSLPEALRLAADLAEKNEQLAQQNAIMAPKASFFDQVASSKDAIDIGTASKVLKIPGIGRNNLFDRLRDSGILMHNNQPYQKYIDAGYFRVIEQKYMKPDGSTNISIKTLVYQKGLDYIRKMLNKEA